LELHSIATDTKKLRQKMKLEQAMYIQKKERVWKASNYKDLLFLGSAFGIAVMFFGVMLHDVLVQTHPAFAVRMFAYYGYYMVAIVIFVTMFPKRGESRRSIRKEQRASEIEVMIERAQREDQAYKEAMEAGDQELISKALYGEFQPVALPEIGL
jgi:hypothetical protein